ncbi:MAG: recombinase family protein [Faecousia sp.]
MARKSRYANDVPDIALMTKAYANRTGIYARVSRSDGDPTSESIKNQIQICQKYIRMSDDLVCVQIYQDDGESGLGFDRPGFRKMMNDIHDGTINCVIVKDVSRMGRDYIGVGKLLLQDFPQLGVRFVSVNDNYDNVDTQDDLWNMDIILKTVLHNRESESTSQRIITAIEAKVQKGEYLPASGSIPYGYLKDTENNTYIPDTETSPVVQKIYALFSTGMTYTEIAKQLNSEGIPCPGKLKYLRGYSKDSKYSDALWNRKTIREILCDQVYIGNRVHGKMKKSAPGKIKHYTSEDDWTIVSNAHPAIISREQFAAVQDIIASRNTDSPVQSKRPDAAPSLKESLLGKLICADCGEPLYADKRCSRAASNAPSQIYYQCRTYKKSKRMQCSNHYLTDAALTEIIDRAVYYNTSYILNSEVCCQIVSNCENRLEALKWKIHSLRQKLEYLDRETDRLFVNYTEGSIHSSEFKQQHTIIKEERHNTEKWLDQIVTECKKTEKHYYSMQFCRQGFINYSMTHKLTKEIADVMIDRIEVHANKDVIVYFKFEGVQFSDTSSKKGLV